jgi:tetratricopeptide (TPR) repeat protein
MVVKRMADLYERIGQLENAYTFFEYALTLNPGDVSMQRKVENLQNKIQDLSSTQMEADIEANPDAPDIDDKRAQIAEIRRQRAGKLIEEAKVRVERNPTDKALRYELGQALFEGGLYTEAIPELQQARSNPHIRTKAMLLLGRCFEKKNMNDLAENVFAEGGQGTRRHGQRQKGTPLRTGHGLQQIGQEGAVSRSPQRDLQHRLRLPRCGQARRVLLHVSGRDSGKLPSCGLVPAGRMKLLSLPLSPAARCFRR